MIKIGGESVMCSLTTDWLTVLSYCCRTFSIHIQNDILAVFSKKNWDGAEEREICQTWLETCIGQRVQGLVQQMKWMNVWIEANGWCEHSTESTLTTHDSRAIWILRSIVWSNGSYSNFVRSGNTLPAFPFSWSIHLDSGWRQDSRLKTQDSRLKRVERHKFFSSLVSIWWHIQRTIWRPKPKIRVISWRVWHFTQSHWFIGCLDGTEY